jgi:DNA-binding SARP family transcriptional activator
MEPLSLSEVTAFTPPVAIFALGQFEILINGVPIRIDGRGPRKPLELLSVLIVAGARGAAIGAVADILWPDADGFDAYRSLITTLHRLRRLLGCPAAIHLGAGRIRLEHRFCEVDAWRFEHAISVAKDREQLRCALAAYPGPFLEENDNPWIIGMRRRLQHLITQAVRTIGVTARVLDPLGVDPDAGTIAGAGARGEPAPAIGQR